MDHPLFLISPSYINHTTSTLTMITIIWLRFRIPPCVGPPKRTFLKCKFTVKIITNLEVTMSYKTVERMKLIFLFTDTPFFYDDLSLLKTVSNFLEYYTLLMKSFNIFDERYKHCTKKFFQ